MTALTDDSLLIDIRSCRYRVMIGVGGIGSGSFFLLNGNETLGREESRSGRFIEKDDYCKLHIISHYVKALLGPAFDVHPIGRVGKDEVGAKLIREMREAGLSLEHIGVDGARHTLFSFCFLYPDRSGGNLTTDDSACSALGPEDVAAAEPLFRSSSGMGVALAVPEVPLVARAALLKLGATHRFLRVASFTTGEMQEVLSSGILRDVDLLCINLEEAASALGRGIEAADSDRLAADAAAAFAAINPGIQVAITHGKKGSYIWDGTGMASLPALRVEAVSTAGAGDAFTAGVIAGMVAGLPLRQAQHLATLTGACSVTSPHTINKGLGRASLLEIARANPGFIPSDVLRLLEAGI